MEQGGSERGEGGVGGRWGGGGGEGGQGRRGGTSIDPEALSTGRSDIANAQYRLYTPPLSPTIPALLATLPSAPALAPLAPLLAPPPPLLSPPPAPPLPQASASVYLRANWSVRCTSAGFVLATRSSPPVSLSRRWTGCVDRGRGRVVRVGCEGGERGLSEWFERGLRGWWSSSPPVSLFRRWTDCVDRVGCQGELLGWVERVG